MRKWNGEFEFGMYEELPSPVEVALTPADTVEFEVTVDSSWIREVGTPTEVFGIEYEKEGVVDGGSVVALTFSTTSDDGVAKGTWYMSQLGTEGTDAAQEHVKVASFDFPIGGAEVQHHFRLGKENEKLFLEYQGSPFAVRKQVDAVGVGAPIRFVTPRRPSSTHEWGMKLKLV